MKPCIRYQPHELKVLEGYLDLAFPITRRHELLPGRSRPSIQKALTRLRRKRGTLYRVRRKP
jgi:hypothetical protein